MAGGSRRSVARDSAGHASPGSAGGLRCSREVVPEAACEFCLMPLIGNFICCSGFGEKFHL